MKKSKGMRMQLIEKIADHLANSSWPTCEFEADAPYYYLHVLMMGKDSYHFLCSADGEDACFVARRNIEGYEEMTSCDQVYDTETLEDASFREVCEDLADQVIEFVENWEE